ncbi:asparaginase [uncultured Pseudodesulfovibrio sp.]|uniref:asparaginase n=1 Tax=uncultured Pseudodesulfovibrio sp. TaxID=2035858 RepID=UPI0029C75934|nr:asparaginase [uncultured Pseudodesulfovibrio sp.]
MPVDNKEIVIFFTGGTIEMAPREDVAGVVPGDHSGDLLCGLPPLPGVNLRPIKWSSLPSGHMTPERMLQLARDIDTALAEESVSGCVVLHGTDLLVESSFVLNMAVTSAKPVVTSGAMRHSGEIGYDGIRNLYDSLLACLAMPQDCEVLIQMGSQLFSAMDTVKTNSVSMTPMVGLVNGCVGDLVDGRVHFHKGVLGTRLRPPFAITDMSPFVPLIACWPGMDGTLIRAALDAGAKALVVEGFGAGNIPPDAAEAVTDALQKGVPVFLASRCLRGGVWPIYGYPGGAAALMQAGAFSAGQMAATKLLLLVKAALGSGYPCDKLVRMLP